MGNRCVCADDIQEVETGMRRIKKQLRKIYKERVERIMRCLNHGKNIIHRKRQAR